MTDKEEFSLNEQPKREKYKEFYGENTKQMELLIKDNRIPMTMKQIIERRLNSKQDDWRDNYFDTCDALVQFKGKIKIIKDCELLKSINSNTLLDKGGIKITEIQYKKLKGEEFNINNLKLNSFLTKEEAKYHSIWKCLLGNLLYKYINLVFLKQKEGMGIYINNEELILNNEELILRAWYVNRLGLSCDAYGGRHLDCGYGRFLGIASEMLGIEVKE